MVNRWLYEASINYGVSNIKRLMLPLLVLETAPPDNEEGLKAYDTSERRRQLLFYMNYTKEGTSTIKIKIQFILKSVIYYREMYDFPRKVQMV